LHACRHVTIGDQIGKKLSTGRRGGRAAKPERKGRGKENPLYIAIPAPLMDMRNTLKTREENDERKQKGARQGNVRIKSNFGPYSKNGLKI